MMHAPDDTLFSTTPIVDTQDVGPFDVAGWDAATVQLTGITTLAGNQDDFGCVMRVVDPKGALLYSQRILTVRVESGPTDNPPNNIVIARFPLAGARVMFRVGSYPSVSLGTDGSALMTVDNRPLVHPGPLTPTAAGTVIASFSDVIAATANVTHNINGYCGPAILTVRGSTVGASSCMAEIQNATPRTVGVAAVVTNPRAAQAAVWVPNSPCTLLVTNTAAGIQTIETTLIATGIGS